MDIKKTVDTLVSLRLILQKQILVNKLLKLEHDILIDEEIPDHHKAIKADLIEDVIKIVKETCGDKDSTESTKEEVEQILGGNGIE